MTPTQERVLSFVRTFINTNGWPPTRVEISKHFGYRSANAAEEHLRALARHGAIGLLPGVSRGIRVLISDTTIECPHCHKGFSLTSNAEHP